MKTKKYFLIPFLAFLACGCQDEEGGTNVSPATGEEVKFSGELPITRTIYGPLTDGAYPIYWVNGDEVIISSPDCAGSDCTSATYRVSVSGETQNYANSLDKTGEIGVRWGDAEQATFYSVYPADAERTTLGSDLKTVTLTMPVQQDNNIVEENGQEIARPDMNSCFMYAKTADVQKGQPVNLNYIPLSTALRFTLHGPTTGDPVTVNFVRIFAPEGTNLTGTITADLSTATESQLPTMRVINSRNYVTMNAAYSGGRYLTLGPGDSMELNAFLTITENTTITDEWYIEIGTSLGNSYKLPFKSVSDQKTLVPGMVHNLGDVPPFNFSNQWDPSNWMANLQRNVYLSEISIPGSWYSLHNAYQGARNNIQAQYNAGVRAFHLDTRWATDI